MTGEKTVLAAYSIHPEPTHMNAPDAWMLYRSDSDGDNEEMIAHGIGLEDIFEQIRMDQEWNA
jgi:hypothetical protein